MKSHRAFWRAILAGVALAFCGYLGFMDAMPEKGSAWLLPILLLYILMFFVGCVILVGAFLYAASKYAAERKHAKSEPLLRVFRG